MHDVPPKPAGSDPEAFITGKFLPITQTLGANRLRARVQCPVCPVTCLPGAFSPVGEIQGGVVITCSMSTTCTGSEQGGPTAKSRPGEDLLGAPVVRWWVLLQAAHRVAENGQRFVHFCSLCPVQKRTRGRVPGWNTRTQPKELEGRTLGTTGEHGTSGTCLISAEEERPAVERARPVTQHPSLAPAGRDPSGRTGPRRGQGS